LKIELHTAKKNHGNVEFLLVLLAVTMIMPQVEQGMLEVCYKRLVQQRATIFSQRLWYVMLEQFLMKYVWSGAGMVIVSIPLMTGTSKVHAGKTYFVHFYFIAPCSMHSFNEDLLLQEL
jgi:hypothetical protein